MSLKTIMYQGSTQGLQYFLCVSVAVEVRKTICKQSKISFFNAVFTHYSEINGCKHLIKQMVDQSLYNMKENSKWLKKLICSSLSLI